MAIIKYIFYSLGYLSSIIFPVYFFQKRLVLLKIFFLAGLYSRTFKSFGKNVIISSNITLHGQRFIIVGNNVSLGANGTLTAWGKYGSDVFTPEIIIDDDAIIGEGFHITAINKIYIGKAVLTGKFVTISDNSHGKIDRNSLKIKPSDRMLQSKGTVYVDENVWIGDKVTILSNVKIGKNAIIGANSVVTKDVKPNTVVGGNPAKVLRDLNEV